MGCCQLPKKTKVAQNGDKEVVQGDIENNEREEESLHDPRNPTLAKISTENNTYRIKLAPSKTDELRKKEDEGES